MSVMTAAYRNSIGDYGGGLITHIGLCIVNATEISGGNPAYARKAVTWAASSGGIIRPNADLTFDIPASTTVAMWKGYGASSGGTALGGAALTNEVFSGQGTYKLLAASTGVKHLDPA